MNIYATIVGSRDIPADYFRQLYRITQLLIALRFTVRSGGATGSDNACDMAAVRMCSKHAHYHPEGPSFHDLLHRSYECYLPGPRFNGHRADDDDSIYIDVQAQGALYEKAEAMALEMHPNPAALRAKPSFLQLHARNMFQVLGRDLETPSSVLVCYAPPQGQSVKGGTRSAFELAKRFNVPRINIHPDAWDADRKKLIKLEEELNVPKINVQPAIWVPNRDQLLDLILDRMEVLKSRAIAE